MTACVLALLVTTVVASLKRDGQTPVRFGHHCFNMNDEIHIEIHNTPVADKSDVNPFPIPLSEKDQNRFFSKIDKSAGETGCWLWTSVKNWGGYGMIKIQGRSYIASRLSWMVHRGRIPDDLCILHNCPGRDNPSCVNPLHLRVGTRKENVMDAELKGQAKHPRGDQHGFRLHPESAPKGIKNNSAKLNDAKVVEIRKLKALGLPSHKISPEFGVSSKTIRLIWTRKAWPHVP